MTDSRIIARCVLMLCGIVAATATMAQDAFPSAAAAAADEKAQKQADRTMYWIRVLAQTPAPRSVAPPKAVAASATAPLRTTAAPERVKVATTTLAAAPSSADVVKAVPESVVAAAPAAVAPSLAAAAGGTGNAGAMSARGVDSGATAGLAAPAIAATKIDVPAVQEEPDPGLIMVKSADPEFPIATMRRLRKGEVEVKFEVGADGAVAAVAVMKTTNPGLNAAAMAAVRQWRFKPTPRGHTAVVELAFDLDA
jgi:TonB family protein